MNTFFDILTATFAMLGGIVFLIGGIGLSRMPDTYTRTSVIATTTSLGLALFTLAVLFHDFTVVNLIKAVLAITMQAGASAVSSIVLNRNAYINDVPLAEHTQYDELSHDRSHFPS